MLFCGSSHVVKNGLRGRKQLYKCKDCGKQFLGGIRRNKAQIITDYVVGKQTIEQLSVKYKVSTRTIQRDLQGMRFIHKISRIKDVSIQMDTTYRERNFGLIKDVLRNATRFSNNKTVIKALPVHTTPTNFISIKKVATSKVTTS